MEKFLSDKINLIAIVFISLFLLFGLVTLSSHGMVWDEAAQHHLAQATLRWIQGQTPDIELLRDDLIYYGSFFEIVNQFFGRAMIGLFGLGYVDAFHLLIFLTLVAGLFFLYLFAKTMFGAKIALWSLLLLMLSPRFIAHGFYNSKDIPVAVFSLICLFFLYRAYQEKKIWFAAVAGLFFGLALATRVNALMVLPIFFIPFALVFWSDLKKNLVLIATFLGASVATVFLAWPALWSNPGLFLKSVNFFLRHGWQGQVLYLGQIYPASQLPWHYAWVYLAITTPILILIFWATGLFSLMGSFRKRDRVLENGLLLSWLFIPILVSMKPGVIKYDGIRHYLIILPALAMIAGVGLDRFLGFLTKLFAKHPERARRIVWASAFLIFFELALEFFSIYPYGDAYFNEGLRRAIPQKIENYFEIEYWGSTYRQGVNWLNQNAREGALVCVPLADHLLQFYPVRPDLSFGCSDQSDYLMFFTRQTFLPPDLDQIFNYSKLSPVFKISRYNSDLLLIYRLKYSE